MVNSLERLLRGCERRHWRCGSGCSCGMDARDLKGCMGEENEHVEFSALGLGVTSFQAQVACSRNRDV